MKDSIHFRRSRLLLREAKRLIPSASQTYSKSYKSFVEGAAPAFLERAKGAYVWDVDGNRYIDFILGLGPITIGHCDPRVNGAVINQLEKGVSFSQPTRLEVELAKEIVRLIPCAKMVKFLKNGSDATSAAVRLARAHTGRDLIACCGYHGWQDWYIGSTSNNIGVPKAVRKLVKSFTYNDIGSLENIFYKNKGRIAAVIMEPVILDYPEDGFLHRVKEIAHKNKALLIFDEVVTGFRLSLSGAQGYFGVTPDLAAFGKGMANGFSISAVAGRADIMRLIDKGAFISSTFGGETGPLAAALETIKILKRHRGTRHFWRLGNYLNNLISPLIKKHNLSGIAEVKGLAPHCGIVFKDLKKLKALQLASVFQQRLIGEGILSLGINNFCLKHTKKDVEDFARAASLGLADVKKAVERGSIKGMLDGKPICPVFKRN